MMDLSKLGEYSLYFAEFTNYNIPRHGGAASVKKSSVSKNHDKL